MRAFPLLYSKEFYSKIQFIHKLDLECNLISYNLKHELMILISKTHIILPSSDQHGWALWSHMILIVRRWSFCYHSPNSTSTQLKSWVWHENDFNSPQPPSPTANSMSLISQLLLTRFQPNFKVRFLGWTTTLTTTLTTITSTTFHLLHTWF